MPDLSKYIPDHISIRRLIAMGIGGVCVYAVFARGGVVRSLQWPIPLLVLALIFGVLFLSPSDLKAFISRVWADSIFRLGAVFTLLIILQLVISDFWLVGTEEGGVELSRAPPRWLPWSVSRADAAEMLVWFVPMFTMVILVRTLLFRRHARVVLHIFSGGALVFGLIGILQFLLSADRVLGIWTVPGDMFFSTFDYVNHAAAWFYLNTFLSGGLLIDSLKKQKPAVQSVVWGVSFLVGVFAGILTSSRFGAVISLGLLAYMLIYFAKHIFKQVRGQARTNIYIAFAVVGLMGAALFFASGGGRLSDEIRNKGVAGEDHSLTADVKGRWLQHPPAWKIFSENRLFGAGGWSYAWLAQLYIAPEDYDEWHAAGKANVHCDPLQFLSEFGMIGFVCLAGIVVSLYRPFVRLAREWEFAVWILVGCSLVLLHSIIDLPFRCPAVLYEWSLLLALIPAYYRKSC